MKHGSFYLRMSKLIEWLYVIFNNHSFFFTQFWSPPIETHYIRRSKVFLRPQYTIKDSHVKANMSSKTAWRFPIQIYNASRITTALLITFIFYVSQYSIEKYIWWIKYNKRSQRQSCQILKCISIRIFPRKPMLSDTKAKGTIENIRVSVVTSKYWTYTKCVGVYLAFQVSRLNCGQLLLYKRNFC